MFIGHTKLNLNYTPHSYSQNLINHLSNPFQSNEQLIQNNKILNNMIAEEIMHQQQPISSVQKINSKSPVPFHVPVMTHYNMPVLHHIPINQVVKKYIPVYYPVPVEHRINIPVKIPIKIPQRVSNK